MLEGPSLAEIAALNQHSGCFQFTGSLPERPKALNVRFLGAGVVRG